MKRKTFLISAVLICITLLIEIFARFYFGLGKVPVYIEDRNFEYIYAPNQNIKRFGNLISTNEYSMRSLPLSETDKVRILKIGDSIINGGSQTDNDSLASTILEKGLSKEFKEQIRVLNAGANSWGPDNGFAYINKYGYFNSSLIVLVFSSHDLYDNMHFQKVVGIHPAWPKSQPSFAITDGLFKYLIPQLKRKYYKDYNEYSYLAIDQNSKKINSGWNNFFEFVKKNNLKLLVYLHASAAEVEKKEYSYEGKKIISMLDSNQVSYIKGIEFINDQSFFRDFIHLNDKGQRKLASVLYPFLKEYVKTQLNR